MSAIEFRHLSLGFNDKLIVHDFSAKLNQGEFIGIFGPNGAGKSTLLRAILGLIKLKDGQLFIFNQPVKRGHRAIGYMPQFRQTTIVSQLSARTYISTALNGCHWGLPMTTRFKRAEIDKVIQLVGIESFVDRPFIQLSGGEKQRVSLAEALLGQPNILLLDEPLSGLDPGQQEKMVSLVKNIQKELHITVLFTAHEVNPLLNAMDSIIYLAHGKAATGTVQDIITSDKLSWLYNAPIEVVKLDNQLFVIHKQSGSNIHEHNHSIC